MRSDAAARYPQVYGDIRDRHFSAVFPVLGQRAKQLQEAHSQRQGMSIEQMKGFIQGEAENTDLGIYGMCEEWEREELALCWHQLSVIDALWFFFAPCL